MSVTASLVVTATGSRRSSDITAAASVKLEADTHTASEFRE